MVLKVFVIVAGLSADVSCYEIESRSKGYECLLAPLSNFEGGGEQLAHHNICLVSPMTLFQELWFQDSSNDVQLDCSICSQFGLLGLDKLLLYFQYKIIPFTERGVCYS